jgi:hypothetical protein
VTEKKSKSAVAELREKYRSWGCKVDDLIDRLDEDDAAWVLGVLDDERGTLTPAQHRIALESLVNVI